MNDDFTVQTPASGVTRAAEFTDFMRRYQDMVFSTAARITANDAQAEDIAQEVFLRAIRENTDLSAHWQSAIDSLRIVLAANQSFRERRTVTL